MMVNDDDEWLNVKNGETKMMVNDGYIGIPATVNLYSLRTGKWPIETVYLHSYKMVMFHSKMLVYQRVRPK